MGALFNVERAFKQEGHLPETAQQNDTLTSTKVLLLKDTTQFERASSKDKAAIKSPRPA